MKIAIVGSQCVGKSTFIKDILAKYKQFSISNYSYRDAIKEENIEENINRQTTLRSQKIIFAALADEVRLAKDNIILDRCVIDAVAYAIWPTLHDQENTDITEADITLFKEAADAVMNLYDLIVYIPVDESIKLEDDNFRDADPEYRLQMAKIFEDLLILDIEEPAFDKYGYKVVSISGDREKRLHDFSELIKHKGM